MRRARGAISSTTPARARRDERAAEIAFENGSSEKVLLVNGDELVGAKQNRILNLTMLVGSGQKLVIPVSCVELGRCSYRSGEFRSARRTLFAKGQGSEDAAGHRIAGG